MGSGKLTLKLHYYRGPRPNFGDDLNALLWREVLPSTVWDASDAVLVGIGSILTEPGLSHLAAPGTRVIVLGSGTSYGAAPIELHHWHVLAVRGPLSANAIRLPASAATDGAYLVADAPAITGPPVYRSETVFIPHHRSLLNRPWADAAAEAGMTFVSPEWPVEEIFEHLARAKLVLTEAMHGAIVADALRIPWIPLAISPALDEFKWRDWLGSLELPFEPVYVPALDPRDLRRQDRLARAMEQRSLGGHRHLEGVVDADQLGFWIDRRYSEEVIAALKQAERGTITDRVVDRGSVLRRSRALASTVASLRRAAVQAPVLSKDSLFMDRLDRLRAAVDEASDLILAG